MSRKKITSIIGWIGVLSILIGYVLLSFDFIEKGLLYNLLNLFGALFVVIEALNDKAYPPVMLNIIWCIVAFISIIS